MTEDYDVIIIGAGIGGLTVGLYLAQAGLRVLVCEQRSAVGGFLTATGCSEHRLDVRLPCVCSQGVLFPVLAELGIDGQQLLVPADWQIVTPRLQLRLNHLEQIRDKFQVLFPHEIKALRGYFAILNTAIQWLKAFFLPHPFMQTAGQQAGLYVRMLKTPGILAKMAWLQVITTPHFLQRQFADPELIRILGSLGYPHMPALLHAGMWYLFLEDYWLPKNGLYGFADTLAGLLRAAHGSIMLRTTVSRINVQNGCAVGVELASGRRITGRYLVSAMDYNATYRLFADDVVLPPRFRRQLFIRKPSESYVTICLNTGLPPHIVYKLGTVHTFCFQDRTLPQGFIVSVPGISGEYCTMPGLQQIYLSCQCSYDQNAEEIKDKLMKAAKLIFPDIGQEIYHAEFWHSRRYEAEFKAWRGASAGWHLHPAHMLIRGFPGWRSPIKNLYHASQWAYSPGGVPSAMLSARQVSKEILQKTCH